MQQTQCWEPRQLAALSAVCALVLLLIFTSITEKWSEPIDTSHDDALFKQRPPEWPRDVPCKPTFMIIGAPKCGTTSLFEYLASHPRIVRPTEKELCFFSFWKRQRVLDTPGKLPTKSWEQYMHAVQGGVKRSIACDGLLSFEACPFYFNDRRAEAYLATTFPALKAIVLLRHPTDRAISAWHDRNPFGRMRVPGSSRVHIEPALRRMLELAQSGNRSVEHRDTRVLTVGLYYYGLERWGHARNASTLLVLRTEDMWTNGSASRPQMAKVTRFLALPGPVSARALLKRHNAAAGHTWMQEQPSRALRRDLDCFFATPNRRLYEWLRKRGQRFVKWRSTCRGIAVPDAPPMRRSKGLKAPRG